MDPTKISLIYDELLRRLAICFPKNAQLRDLEDLSNNPDIVLKAAYGIQPGSGENTDKCIDTRKYYLQREFEVVLTREMLRQTDDVNTMHLKWKAILEDLHIFLKNTAGQIVMGARGDLAFNVKYESDQGPRSIQIGESAYGFIEALVIVEYSESTNGGI